MNTFDELFDEFFNEKNEKGKDKKKRKPKSKHEDFGDELSSLMNTLSNFRQITDSDEQYEIENEFGDPHKIEFFEEEGLFFKRSIWEVEDGEVVKLEVSDQPFQVEELKTLEELLQDALETENYELAAEIRDEMNKNKKN